MSEVQMSLLSPKEQKLLKPNPEAIAAEVLNKDMQKDVANLCDCIRANNLRIKWVGKNGWEVATNKTQVLRRIRINPADKYWYMTKTFNMFGRMCENQCCNSQIKIMNPTGKALEHTKTLILTARDIANAT